MVSVNFLGTLDQDQVFRQQGEILLANNNRLCADNQEKKRFTKNIAQIVSSILVTINKLKERKYFK